MEGTPNTHHNIFIGQCTDELKTFVGAYNIIIGDGFGYPKSGNNQLIIRMHGFVITKTISIQDWEHFSLAMMGCIVTKTGPIKSPYV